jgi:protein arginine N-methyltransferase 1
LADLEEHRRYVADAVRIGAYRDALGLLDLRGQAVADLGCGTGILGLLALQSGARHVHFIEETALIEVAREVVRRAGFSAQSTFHYGRAQQVRLPEPVDMAICDHIGYFGFDYGLLDLLSDARRRMLRPGGAAIPRVLRLEAALAASAECDLRARGWDRAPVPTEMHWVNRFSRNKKLAVELAADALCSAPVEIAMIDLSIDNEPLFEWEFKLHASRPGPVDGICAWFSAELAPHVWMTNSPIARRRIDRPQAFLPFEHRLDVAAGDVLDVQITARPGDGLIAWRVQATRPSAGEANWQSTWHGELLSPDDLRLAPADHVPRRRNDGEATMLILSLCDGTRTREALEREALAALEGRFASDEAALRFVQYVL